MEKNFNPTAVFYVGVSAEPQNDRVRAQKVVPISGDAGEAEALKNLVRILANLSGPGRILNATLPNPVEIVKPRIEEIRHSSFNRHRYTSFPGRYVYLEDVGCPEGGAEIAAIQTEDNPASVIQTAAQLRGNLRTEDIVVISSSGGAYRPTIGFSMAVGGNLHDVARAWQLSLRQYFFDHLGKRERDGVIEMPIQDIHFPCWVYQKGSEQIIQAVADPQTTTNPDQWQRSILEIASQIPQAREQRVTGHCFPVGVAVVAKPKGP